MSNFKIEKGIPIPSTLKSTGITATMRALQPGDSFCTPRETIGSRTGLYFIAKKLGIRITLRQQTDGSYRIWRIV